MNTNESMRILKRGIAASVRAQRHPYDGELWWDDDGVWFQLGAQTYGPYDTEEQASAELMLEQEGL